MKVGTMVGLAAMAGLFAGASASSGALIMQYKAADYNTTAHTLVNAANPGTYNLHSTWSPTLPTLVAGQTANGSSVLRFAQTTTAQLLSIISGPSLTDFTIFAYARPLAGTTGRADFVGTGSLGAVEYFVNLGGKQGLNAYNSEALKTGTTTLSTTDFSNVNVTGSSTGGTFRLNGVADGSTKPHTFPSSGAPMTYIGGFVGAATGASMDIAEIRVYDTVLSDAERATIEGELNAAYVPEPTSVGLLCAGGLALFRRRRVLPAS